MVAVPTRGAIRWETVTRLEEARDRTPGLRPILYQPGNLSVALTRNQIVRKFMQTGCETLVMVDDDVVPPPDFIEILDRELSGFGMVAVPHVMPQPGNPGALIATAYTEAAEGLVTWGLSEGITEVAAVATGCVAVSAHALEQVGPDPFRIAHNPDDAIVSDDFLFCALLRRHGFRVGAWWDGWHCDHVTTVSLAPIFESQQRQLAERST